MDGLTPILSVEYKHGDVQLAVDIKVEPDEIVSSVEFRDRVLIPALRSLQSGIDKKNGLDPLTESLMRRGLTRDDLKSFPAITDDVLKALNLDGIR